VPTVGVLPRKMLPVGAGPASGAFGANSVAATLEIRNLSLLQLRICTIG
jgi:ribosomal protein RSM22 (predicted rRNA methylase)